MENNIVNTRTIQFHPLSLYSVFIFENILDQKYLKQLTKKVDEITNTDVEGPVTNVKAYMTDWKECLNHKEFNEISRLIIQFLNTVLRLRSPHNTVGFVYTIKEMWAMRHKKEDYTALHDHMCDTDWSGAFYCRVPGETVIEFPEFTKREHLKENTLYLFPSMLKHEVFKQTYDEHRLSIAFNLNVTR